MAIARFVATLAVKIAIRVAVAAAAVAVVARTAMKPISTVKNRMMVSAG
jgi:hypothetical protein